MAGRMNKLSGVMARYEISQRELANILEINYKTLSLVFKIESFKISSKKQYNEDKPQPFKVKKVLDLFKKLGIPRVKDHHFKCPFHKMNGSGNLFVNDSGGCYCFHCMRRFKDADDFKSYWDYISLGVVKI